MHAGSFRDKVRAGDLEKGASLSEQIAVRQEAQGQSHTAGFEVRPRCAALCPGPCCACCIESALGCLHGSTALAGPCAVALLFHLTQPAARATYTALPTHSSCPSTRHCRLGCAAAAQPGCRPSPPTT